MGADHKGPLAAFVVVAVIAAVLLVTSVRSQAASGWLNRHLPASVVAGHTGRRSATASSQVVRHGAVLVHRATAARTGDGTSAALRR